MKPAVIVPMGNVALRRITGLSGIERHNAYVIPTPYGIPAVPTFHPSYIMQGNAKLSGLWCYAVERALKLAKGAEKQREYELLLDPPLMEARAYFARDEQGPLACDIETFEVSDDEDERDDDQSPIIRISFSNRAGTGISMPWQEPYISLVKDVLGGSEGRDVIFWNQSFDVPRLRAAGICVAGRVIDAMFAWHWLQSDLPKALGFVAPLYLPIAPWKHLSAQSPAFYSAKDSAVAFDLHHAIKADCGERWGQFERHCVQMFPILERMSAKGIVIDAGQQQALKGQLEAERAVILAEIQAQVPIECRREKRWKKRGPTKPDEWPDLVKLEDGSWLAHEPFNPDSSDQVIALIRALGLPVPKAKGEDRETTESKHLKKLAKKAPIFRLILDHRERSKLIDTYMWPLDGAGRVHTTFSFHPSTWRKSSRGPNLQNIPKRNDLAQAFRRMVRASPGCLLVECDSSAIEAVLVGFFAGSQRYIELARRGVHKWLAQEFAHRPVSKSEPLYDQIKRVVHLSNYMGTPQRIAEEYPLEFTSVKMARELQEFYFSTPEGQDIKRWQQAVLQQAHREHQLQNPFGYRHYFYDVFGKRNGEWTLGDDAKRAIAFLPQSTASAMQTEFVLEIERAHPELAEGLRLMIHDSLVLDVPERDAERLARELHAVMIRPFPELNGLWVGAECKYGENLADMHEIKVS